MKHYRSITYILLAVIVASYSFFIPVYAFYHQNVLFLYSIFAASISLLFIFLSSFIPELVVITASLINLDVYAIIYVLQTQSGAGCELLPLSVTAAVFLLTHNIKKNKLYYILIALPSALITLFITVQYNWTPHENLPYPVSMYHHHQMAITLEILVMMMILCISAEKNLREYIEKVKKQNEELIYIANHDPLTKLINRRRLWEHFLVVQEQYIKHKKNYAICIFDIDNFKKVNDTYGHDCGDFVLSESAKLIHNTLLDRVKLGRWGGEEFILLYPDYNDIETLADIERIRKLIAQHDYKYHDSTLNITMTFGVCSSTYKHQVEDILNDADHQLMKGKIRGKNCITATNIVPEKNTFSLFENL